MVDDKIQKVAGVAQSDKRKSAQDFRLSQQAHQQKCDQLNQLQTFKSEYEERLKAMSEQGIAARQLQDYRQFLGKLNQAIDQQTREIGSSSVSVDSAREQWVAKTRRSSALDQVVDQQRTQQRQARDKAEQRESDEQFIARPQEPQGG
tara:strand:- start:3700 stop:4143 length:444 start_codon:yes stop_codon:yes gene_type:complete